MKKQESVPLRFTSLAEAHRALGLPAPLHPLISLLRNAPPPRQGSGPPRQHVLSFYKVSFWPRQNRKLRYGQGHYDFEAGGLLFAAPGQLLGGTPAPEADDACAHVTLLIHPDFLASYPLAKKIHEYGFFTYAANEALHVSEQEREVLLTLFRTMEAELASRLDEFSQDVVIAQLDLLLTYANRFYKRQFLTRKAVHSDLLQRLEATLADGFRPERLPEQGIPTVYYLAQQLHPVFAAQEEGQVGLEGGSVGRSFSDNLRQAARHVFVGASGVEAHAEQRIGLGNAGEELLHTVARTLRVREV